MKKHHSESLEEMVFSNRNHQYGAYRLRKTYSKHVAAGLFISILLLISAIAYPVFISYFVKVPIPIPPPRVIDATLIDKPPSDIPVPPVPPPVADVTRIRFVAPKIIENDTLDQPFGNQDALATNKPVPVPLDENNIQPGSNTREKTIEVTEKLEPPLKWAPEMPEFPGGTNEMMNFILKMIRYPDNAKDANIVGIVYIEFTVEKNGSLTDITLKRGIGGGCDDEALRVVHAMPPWNPGKQDGIPVRVRCILPVKFTLRN